MPAPKSVLREDMLKALEPLGALLNLNPRNTYSINISATQIDVVAGEERVRAKAASEDDAAAVVATFASVEVI